MVQSSATHEPREDIDMAYFEEGSEAMVALEAMVDKAGVPNVIWALAYISWAKADHAATNWQDKMLAHAWKRTARQLDKFTSEIDAPF
jgi:hypothetical protein